MICFSFICSAESYEATNSSFFDHRYVRLLCIVASVLCYTQTLALAVICTLCFVLLMIVLYRPPFQVAAVNYCVLGTTSTALLTNVVLFRAAWSLKDIDHVTSSVYVEQRPFLTFAHPEALGAWAGGMGVALPREQLCKTVSEEHDVLVSEVCLYAHKRCDSFSSAHSTSFSRLTRVLCTPIVGKHLAVHYPLGAAVE